MPRKRKTDDAGRNLLREAAMAGLEAKVVALDEQIAKLKIERDEAQILLSQLEGGGKAEFQLGPPKRSAEARAKQSAAMKETWARRRKQAEAPETVTTGQALADAFEIVGR